MFKLFKCLDAMTLKKFENWHVFKVRVVMVFVFIIQHGEKQLKYSRIQNIPQNPQDKPPCIYTPPPPKISPCIS